MTKRIIPLLALLIVLGTGSPARAQEKLSLKQCVDLVLAESDQVKMASEAVFGAELKVDESKSLWWPTAGLSANYLRSSFFGSFDFPMNGQTYKIQFGLANSYRAALAVNGIVFNWGRTAKTVELGRAALALAQDGVAGPTNRASERQVLPTRTSEPSLPWIRAMRMGGASRFWPPGAAR